VASPPQATAGDELLEFLFHGASTPYAELKRKAAAGEPLPAVTFSNVSVTFDLDVRYETIATKRSRNVVAAVEGSDPQLRDTYVAFGAHYDHLGTVPAEAAAPASSASCSQASAAPAGDRVFNGADDNASGTAAMLALAREFARGPKPRRSVLFVWHTGEERGLWGSQYYAGHPTVPFDAIVAHVNLDMVGRSYEDRPDNADKLFLVGSDWISSELHAAALEANTGLRRPFAFDFSMNSPSGGGLAYYRSDHYSYASKGVPSVFITSGPHSDYHAASDTADKIDYAKLARVVEYAGALGSRLANLDRPPARDFAGPRAGVLSRPTVAGGSGGVSCPQ
jgi:Zn-dependent M28 family amino/carboxypeptidase